MVKTHNTVNATIKSVGVFIAALLLSGCAVVWPRMKHMEKLADQASGPRGCASVESYSKVDQNRQPIRDKNNLPVVEYLCLDEAIDELEDMEGEIGRYHRGLGYTAVAAGTYAGYQATRATVAKVPLRNIGIALAGLAGFNQATGADARLPVISAGLDALTCVRETAIALENTSKIDTDTALFSTKSTQAQVSERPTFEMQVLMNTDAQAGSQASAKDSLSTKIQDSAKRLLNEKKTKALQAATEFNAQVDASHINLPTQIYMFVDRIRRVVRSQLASGQVNLKDLFSQQQQAVEQMSASVLNSNGKATESMTDVRLATGSTAAPPAAPIALSTVFNNCVASTGSNIK